MSECLLLFGPILKEKFIKKVQKVTEEGDEVEVDEDWEFLTEEEMQDKQWSEMLCCIHRLSPTPLYYRKWYG